jgi:15-cis-phytoene synthase
VLYTFFRLVDEIVDQNLGEDEQEVKAELESWKNVWEQEYNYQEKKHPVLSATVDVFKKYNIPKDYAAVFFDAMAKDTYKKRYQTYKELEEYMYGSAAVVGLMLCHIIGFKDNKALYYATKMGYAMQLTNFLRDIGEDVVLRDRIYLPLEELAQFNISEEDIVEQKINENFTNLMKFQIKRSWELYKEAEQGLLLLDSQGRFAIKVASRIYSEILKKIEKNNYNVFSNRAHTKLWEKFFILVRCFIQR